MIFAFDYESFLKDPSVCCENSSGQSPILQTEIRLARVSWQETGVRTTGLMCGIREQ